jgi:hypothetical protein
MHPRGKRKALHSMQRNGHDEWIAGQARNDRVAGYTTNAANGLRGVAGAGAAV